ncbi:hypothetical protein [Paenibacillus lemnae]|uniref:Amidase n=1 Tax=Paenibacillus lemnae TaxID=1330551 RepID=A0A848MD73_PAELE|nr:hypothetical protein [Paenibacillus lemnae]NMO98141.1 hypothetical protein [Paenibacillus lemnae]
MKKVRTSFKMLFLLSCSLLLLSGFSYPPKPQSLGTNSNMKAVWLWDTPFIKENPASILAFAEQTGLDTIYLQMNRDVRPEYYKSFIKAAGKQNIEIHVLGGAPSWSLKSERHRLDAFLTWTKEYQDAAAPEERFTGIHVDVEPHGLAQWKTNQADLIRQWQDNTRYLAEGARALNLPITADIPFWIYQYQLPDGSMSMSRWMLTQMDGVAIMAYRDQADKIYSAAAVELKEADELGKKAWIAVETKSSNEGAFITFYEEDAPYMDEQLQLLNKKAALHSSFSGFAIHDYKAYKALVEKE